MSSPSKGRYSACCGSTSPGNATMRISHEAIYQALYVQGARRAAPWSHGAVAHWVGAARAAGAHPGAG